MARFRFTGRFPSSGRRKSSVNRFLRENIKTGLEGPDKAKYQHQGVGQIRVSKWARPEYRTELKRLNQPVQQQPVETTVAESDTILVMLVESVHG
jgi:hypothetical protein